MSLDTRPGYIPALDGLRAFAVLAVLAYHSGTVLSSHPGGIGGVDVFFVISGFVITRLLLSELSRTSRIDLVRFYGRRAIRLYPALLCVVLITSIFWWVVGSPSVHFVFEVVGSLLYLTPVTTVVLPHLVMFSHTWTLGIEEYFYLALPLFLLIARPWRLKQSQMIALFLSAGVAMLGAIAVARFMTEDPSALLNYFLRAGGLFLGCAAAVLMERGSAIKSPIFVSFVGVLGIAAGMAILGLPKVGGLGFLTIDISTMAVILSVSSTSRNAVGRVLSWKPLVYIGRISYEIYLWHLPLLVCAGLLLPNTGLLVPLVSYALTLLLAVVTHHGLAPLQNSLRRSVDRRSVPSGQLSHGGLSSS